LASQRLLTSAVTDKVRPLLEDALSRGAHFIAGEIRDDGPIMTPVVLGGMAPSSQLLRADIFAPILAIVTVVDDHEAILRANDCPFALGASIFSRDESAARSLAARINAGVVTINDLILPTADARTPFGGRGRSGFGVTQGAEGLLELTRPKVITASRARFRPAFDAPQPGDEQMFQSYLKATHGRGLKYRWHALVALIRNLAGRNKSPQQNTK
jgi:acyl-CoA reductase-like NAD-dependent aldehyde dehydrogenase